MVQAVQVVQLVQKVKVPVSAAMVRPDFLQKLAVWPVLECRQLQRVQVVPVVQVAPQLPLDLIFPLKCPLIELITNDFKVKLLL